MLLITLLCSFVTSHVISIERNLEPVLITKLQYFKLPGGDCSAVGNYFVKYNNSLTVECPFRPIEWIYKTKPTWKYTFQEITSNSSLFTIRNLNYTNDGCICCRSKDFSLACTHVKVEGPPIRNTLIMSTSTYCKKTVEMKCPFTGYPPLNYTWSYWKRDKKLEFPDILKSQIHDPAIKIKGFLPEIGGQFLCGAQNKYGVEGVDGKYSDRFTVEYPIDCQLYEQFLGANLSPEYTGTIGGNVTMTCTLQFDACSSPNKCAKHVTWDNSSFPQNRTISVASYDCSICTGWQSRTIIDLQMSDFNKQYTCHIAAYDRIELVYNTTLKIAPLNTQSIDVATGLVPTIFILIIIILSVGMTLFIGVYYKRKITMFFYYRLSKEPPYEEGLQYDVFISFSSRDINFVGRKIHNVIKDAGYEVIWYPDDFRPGAIILPAARDSIWKSRKTILCLSKNFLQSEYCAAEKEFCFQKAMETFKNFLIIIHLDDCEIPADLKKLKIIEMVQVSEEDKHLKAISNLKYLLKAPIDSKRNN